MLKLDSKSFVVRLCDSRLIFMVKHAVGRSLNISMQIGQFHYQDLNVPLFQSTFTHTYTHTEREQKTSEKREQTPLYIGIGHW